MNPGQSTYTTLTIETAANAELQYHHHLHLNGTKSAIPKQIFQDGFALSPQDQTLRAIAPWSPSQGILLDLKPTGIAFFTALNRQQLPTDAQDVHLKPPTHKRLSRSSSLAELTLDADSKMEQAAARREASLAEKQNRAKNKTSWMKHRVIMANQSFALKKLRQSTKADFAMASAYLKRQLLIQERVERHARHVAYAHNVSLLKKLDNSVKLRKSVSTTFADLILRADELEKLLDVVGTLDIAEQLMDQALTDATDANGVMEVDLPAKEPTTQSAFSPVAPPTKTRLAMNRSVSVPDLLAEHVENPLISLDAVFGDALPPITRFTLAELDTKMVLRDWQVRHDMCFDPDLCFKPNDRGAKGEAKRQRKEIFWAQVAKETLGDGSDTPNYTSVLVLVNEMKAIILELAPWKDSFIAELEDKIDIRLIDQQLKHNVFDFRAFMEYIGKTLQSLCAPFRDPEVDKVTKAAEEGDFIGSLKHCFNLLEYMKLDIVNRNLVKLRPWVLEQAVEFELGEFQDRLSAGELTLDKTTAWLATALPRIYGAQPNIPMEQAFLTAYVELIRDAAVIENYGVPETFLLDRSRLATFYSTWEELAIFACVMMVFRQALGNKANSLDTKDAQNRLRIVLDDKDTVMDHLHLELVSQAGKLRGKDFTEAESKFVQTMLEKTLSPGSKVYELMLSRVGLQLTAFLKDGKVASEELKKQGISELEVGLVELGNRMRHLAQHNKSVFEPIYSEIGKQVMAQIAQAAATTTPQ